MPRAIPPKTHANAITDIKRGITAYSSVLREPPLLTNIDQSSLGVMHQGHGVLQALALSQSGRITMKHMIISLLLLGGVVALSATEASAVVCARGVHRAGCVT